MITVVRTLLPLRTLARPAAGPSAPKHLPARPTDVVCLTTPACPTLATDPSVEATVTLRRTESHPTGPLMMEQPTLSVGSTLREDYLGAGREAVDYVESLGLTSTIRDYLSGEDFQRVNGQLGEVRQAASQGTDAWDAINRSADAAEQHRVGNCGEMADIAFRQLKNQGLTNLVSVVATSKNKGYAGIPKANHGFLVLGLAPNAEIAEPDTWGPRAVVVDPFHRFAGTSEDGLAGVRAYMEAHGCERFDLEDAVVKGRGETDPLAWQNLSRRL